MDPLARARAIALDVLDRVERRCYGETEIRQAFCRRSAAEVFRDGHVHFGTPCHDLVTAAGAELRAAGFRPVPVLCRIKRFLRPVKFQCGLELDLGGDPFYLGFSVTVNRLAPGRFVPAGGRTDVYRADPEAAPPGAPHLLFFGIGSPEELDRAIAGHKLEKHLRTYRGTASLAAFASARARAHEKAAAARPGEDWLLGPGRWAPAGTPAAASVGAPAA